MGVRAMRHNITFRYSVTNLVDTRRAWAPPRARAAIEQAVEAVKTGPVTEDDFSIAMAVRDAQ